MDKYLVLLIIYAALSIWQIEIYVCLCLLDFQNVTKS